MQNWAQDVQFLTLPDGADDWDWLNQGRWNKNIVAASVFHFFHSQGSISYFMSIKYISTTSRSPNMSLSPSGNMQILHQFTSAYLGAQIALQKHSKSHLHCNIPQYVLFYPTYRPF